MGGWGGGLFDFFYSCDVDVAGDTHDSALLHSLCLSLYLSASLRQSCALSLSLCLPC